MKKGDQFKQQHIPAFVSTYSVRCVLPILLLTALFFMSFGIGIILSISYTTDHIELDYSKCSPTTPIAETSCADYLKRSAIDAQLPLCNCLHDFTVPKLIKAPIYIYYRVENFYQNERMYARSVDYNQLGGHFGPLSIKCDPYRTLTVNSTEYNIAPCGMIANSMFNDSFTIKRTDPSTLTLTEVPLIRTGISYIYDKKYRFKNPPSWNNTIKPLSWRKSVFELDPQDPSNNGYENEDLMVWLRPGAYQSPRKLYRFVNHSAQEYKNGLPAGNYTLFVEFNFPVEVFGGKKKLIILSPNWMGTTSLFLPVMYLLVGTVTIFTMMALVIVERHKRK